MERPPSGELHGRRILLVAHDFPPVRSPQAIRATFLCKGLLDAGAVVFVLSRGGLPSAPLPPALSHHLAALTVHQCSPGLFESLIAKVAHRHDHTPSGPKAATQTPVGPPTLNWKGRSVRYLRHALGWLHFPDERSAWIPAARRWLRERAPSLHIDAAVLMHEPAAGVRLWPDVDSLGIPWGVDLADPILAPYTRRHWQRRARRLEADVLRHARMVSVTNRETATLLEARHGGGNAPIHVLPQGHVQGEAGKGAPSTDLILVYTGRFYRFRPADALVYAVMRSEGVRLRIAGPELPDEVIDAARRRPDKIQLLGELGHDQSLLAQREADVLVSVGNQGTVQTPGKVIEYFGASRPILHLVADDGDPIPALLTSLRRGVGCSNTVPEVMAVLERLSALKQAGALDAGFDLRRAAVEDYSWHRIGERFAGLVAGMCRPLAKA